MDIKRTWKVFKSYIPEKLPHGMTEFESWTKSIIELSRAPDNESTRFAVAVMILHMDAGEDTKPKRFFVKKLNKAAANELANGVAMKLKEDQKKRQDEEAASKLAAEVAREVQPAS